MGNETTAGTVAGLSPVAVLVEGLATYFFPEPLSNVPAGTVAAAFLSLAAYLLPTGSALLARVLGASALALVLGMGAGSLLGGCSAIGPTLEQRADGSWKADAGQYALVDRLPGDDQQAETSTMTGLSIRDMSIGVAQRDVLRQPVAETPLYGVGFSRTQDVSTGMGDTIKSDYASGDAFEEDEEQ